MNDLAREAQWSVTPEAELQRALEAGTVLSRRFFLQAPFRTAFFTFGMAILGLGIYSTLTEWTPGTMSAFSMGVFFWSVLSMPIVRKWEASQDEARENERSLEAEFGLGQGCFVSMIVRQGDAPTGEDSGMLWFEEGRLYFSGHRTSFGLFPSQVFGRAIERKSVPGVRNAIEVSLRHRTPTGPMALSFGIPERPQENVTVERSILKAHLDRWLDEKTTGEGQWPPTELGPKRVSEAGLLAGTLAWSLLPTALVGGIFRLFMPEWAFSGCAITLAGFISAVPACNLRWRALRDRRGLRKSR